MTVEDKLVIKNLAQTAQVINTINGGMSQPIVSVSKGPEEWTIKARVPGVDADHMKIEVKDNYLYLFHLIEDEQADMELPLMLAAISISNRVQYDLITAAYENAELEISLPLDQENKGYEREIDIFKK